MSINSSILKPGHFQQHLIAREHQSQKSKRNLLVSLTLTAMVDMFAVLVIFLLQSFSASPELLIIKGVTLPSAHTGAEVRDVPVIALAQDKVYLDQKPVGEISLVMKKPEILAEKLTDIRKKWATTKPDIPFRGEINLQADRSIPSSVISQFMTILTAEHFGEVLLAVVGENAK